MHIVAYSVVTQRHLVSMQRHVKDETLKGKHVWALRFCCLINKVCQAFVIVPEQLNRRGYCNIDFEVYESEHKHRALTGKLTHVRLDC
jgi:hypothetical protein